MLERKGKPTTNEDGTSKKVTVKIMVNESAILTQEVDANLESLSATFTNKGWVNIKVLIDGTRYTEDYSGMDLETQTSITID